LRTGYFKKLGTPNVIPGLRTLAIYLGLLIRSSEENAVTQLLDLQAIIVPKKSRRFEITNVKPAFLYRAHK
jgi:hypothetical protein